MKSGLRRPDYGQQESQSFEQAEVVAGGAEDGVASLADGPGEVVSAHAGLGLGMCDERFGRQARSSSRLMVSMTRRFWPEYRP